MLVYSTIQEAEQAISQIAVIAKEVNDCLLGHTEEAHFQKAMEIVLKEVLSLRVEAERIQPVSIRGIHLRDVRDEIDLLVHVPVEYVEGFPNAKSVQIVCELKVYSDAAAAIPQVLRYIASLSRGATDASPVYHRALLLNFRPGIVPGDDVEKQLRDIDRKIAGMRNREGVSIEWYEQMKQKALAGALLSPSKLAEPEVLVVSAANLPAGLFQRAP
jgi:hypothetical protein